MNVVFRAAADLVFIIHLLFILAVIFGAVLVLRWPRLAWLHLPIVGWGLLVEATGLTCPLTPLEKQLLVLAGQESYQGSFIAHYLVPIIYPDELTPTVRTLFSAIIATINITLYLLIWRRLRAPSV